jgi:ADP-L-glycero-D-manno-heptose 6-epimerase
MKILITGGSGFVGKNLTEQLVNDGHEVTITSTGYEPTFPGVSNILYIGLNGINYNLIPKVDAVIHLMANNNTLDKNKQEMFRINFHEPRELFYQIKSKGCSCFIYASSTAVYGSQPAPYIENETIVKPLNVYGESKAAFDNFAMNFASNFSVTVYGLRYCNIYGPGEEQKGRRMSMIGQILLKTIKGKTPNIFEYGEQKRDCVYVKDVVQANIKALEKHDSKVGSILNIGSGNSYTFNEIIKEISEVTKKEIKPNYIPCPFPENYQNYTECNIDKAKKELGYEPKFSLKLGIEEYYKYLISSF